MKKCKTLLLFFLCLSISAIAQEEDETVNLKKINDKKHELRIDALEGLAIPTIDISYEYVINKYSGAGISISVALDEGDIGFPQDYSISPYFRQYFFNKEEYG